MKTDLKYEGYEQYEIASEEPFAVERLKELGLNETFHHKFRFENNYGASVIKYFGSYGYDDDLFELAVLKFNGDIVQICYDTPLTNDVLGYLTNDDVLSLLDAIKNLEIRGAKT